MSNPVKLCSDCKYFKISKVDTSRYSKCSHPNMSPYLDMVIGKVVFSYANINRNKEFLCGKDAKYFEEKVSLFTKLKNKLTSLWRK